jgi:hypothetical protein
VTTSTGAFPPAQLIMQRCAGNPYYRKAVDSPEYREAIELRAKAMRIRGDLPRVERHHAMPPATADGDFGEWLDLVVQVAEHERNRTAKIEALNTLIAECEASIGGVAVNPDQLIPSLAKDLDELMRDVAEVVGQLNGCHNATAIVASDDADALSAWQELKPLRQVYDDIYQAFDWMTAGDQLYHLARSDYLYDDLASDARIRNIDDVFPAWKRPTGRTAFVREWEQSNPAPWPKDLSEQLVWLCTSAAEPWVPTRSQLSELRNQKMQERAHPNGVATQPQSPRQDLGPHKAPRPEPPALNDDEMFDDDMPNDGVSDHDTQFSVMPDLGALTTGVPSE